MSDAELYAPRTVRPRSRQYKRLPVVAMDNNNWVDEDGQLGPVADLLTKLPDYPSTLFAMVGAPDFVSLLNEHYLVSHPDAWQWRITSQEKGITTPGRFRVAARVTTVVHYFGFKNGNYHKIIDPITMYGRKLDDIWPSDEPVLVRLMQWATAIRDLCDENSMEVRATIGSISGQFLTDHRFYPKARRKVPSAINERARENLPGNHYVLSTHPSPRHEFTAWYLDQHHAHHYHARTTPLPNANSLYAFGRFVDLGAVSDEPITDDFTGLYCLTLAFPKDRDAWGWLKPGRPHYFVFSNELPILLDMDYRVTGVIAAWGSHKRDGGIARYATWAESQLDRFDNAPWLKPLLLATYGTLATRPSWGETVFKLAKRGQMATVYTGRKQLTGTLVRAPQKLEPKIANVIHRGMIEAGTRADSVGLAHWLTHKGFRPLSIYADAVMIEVDESLSLPNLPEPWRLKQTLNHLQFVSKQAFISGEMTKLPGVSREYVPFARGQHKKSPPRRWYDVISGRMLTRRQLEDSYGKR